MAAVDYGTDVRVYPNGIGKRLQPISQRALLLEAMCKRLETPRGWLAQFGGDPEYGYSLEPLLNAKISPARKAAEETQIQQELLKDDRIFKVDVGLAISIITRKLTITIQCTPKNAGPFSAILSTPLDALSLLVVSVTG